MSGAERPPPGGGGAAGSRRAGPYGGGSHGGEGSGDRDRSSVGEGSGGGEARGERVQKILAQAGLGSRRACEDLIAAGRVRVNGRVVELGARADAEVDRIEVDGAPIGTRAGLVHYLLNKPNGVVTTVADPQGRPTVVDLVPPEPRVFPVGRLDTDTEGLLLLTNDGDLAHRLTHPSFGVDKEYLAEVEGTPPRGAVRRLREGVELDDGPTAPARVSTIGDGLLRITIHEGRNRQVRRMCAAVGHPVRRLVRVRIGPIADRRLRPGEWRPLTQAEVRSLERAVVNPAARETGPGGRPGRRPRPPVAGRDAMPGTRPTGPRRPG